jgi:hypothetical protein
MPELKRSFRREAHRQYKLARRAYSTGWPRSMKRKGSVARRELARETRKTRKVFRARQALKI